MINVMMIGVTIMDRLPTKETDNTVVSVMGI
jgi:hypothetical protein